MTIFLSGGAKCGKSHYAQDLAVWLAGGGKRYYVATMIPTGDEDYGRIRKHLADRDGMEFETIECFCNILDTLKQADKNSTFLVDNITSLLQNAMFPVENGYQLDLAAAERCAAELEAFAGKARHVIYISDYIYSDAERYSETTECYRKCLAEIDRRMAKICDVVVEVSASYKIFHKGELAL